VTTRARPPAPRGRRQRQQIGLLFRGLNTGFREALDDALRDAGVGLTYGPVTALSLLRFQPGANGAELALAGRVSAQAMNIMLKRLEGTRHVERRAHPGNPRADAWHLTPKGSRLVARAHGVFDAVVSRMLSALAPAEVVELERLLVACAQGLAFSASSRGKPPAAPAPRH
jgi:DNA-binding MarR family transcriptional regulator